MYKILLPFILLLLAFTTSIAQRQFWGTSMTGGDYGNGFIFRTDSIGDNLEIVHHFKNEVDGANIGSLLLASNGKLYGMAAEGGQNSVGVFGGGTFFEYDLAIDQFRVLEHFGPANTALPGITTPLADGRPGLTEVAPGKLMGLMQQGGYAFLYDIGTGVFTKPFTVPNFNGGATNTPTRNYINQAFIKAADGKYYASTQTNSACPIGNPVGGSIMRVTASGATPTLALTTPYLANCQLAVYGHKILGFFAQANGKLYGSTAQGGVSNKGVIFEYNPTTNVYTRLYDFTGGTTDYQCTALAFGKNGKLYGTAWGGGIPEPDWGLSAGGGVLYEYNITTGAFAVKHNFTITGQSINDMGVFPSGLINSLNGKLYGATQYGVFEYNPVTDEIRTAGRFNALGFAPSFVQICRKPAYVQPATATYTLCQGAAFSLDLASANATTVVWKHNGVTDASRTTPVLNFTSFAEADAGTWICTLTNECGTTVAQTITLQYGQPAAPTITASGPVSLCAGETVTLTASAGYTAYTWSTGQTTAAITVGEAAIYSVTGNNGCESDPSQPVAISVRARPAKPQPPMASGAVAFCAGQEVTLTAPPGYTAYAWSDGQTTPSITVNQTGAYAVSVSDGCMSAPSDPTAITVYTLPPAPTTIERPVYNKLRAVGGGSTYEWALDGQILQGMHTAEIEATASGIYTVRSVSEHDCRSTSFASLDFDVTAIAEDAGHVIRIYPNPAHDVIHIAGTAAPGASSIIIYDVAGHPVLQQTIDITREPRAVFIDHLAAGLYQVMVTQAGKVALQKLAIR